MFEATESSSFFDFIHIVTNFCVERASTSLQPTFQRYLTKKFRFAFCFALKNIVKLIAELVKTYTILFTLPLFFAINLESDLFLQNTQVGRQYLFPTFSGE